MEQLHCWSGMFGSDNSSNCSRRAQVRVEPNGRQIDTHGRVSSLFTILRQGLRSIEEILRLLNDRLVG